MVAFALSIVWGQRSSQGRERLPGEAFSQLKEKWNQLPIGHFYLDFCKCFCRQYANEKALDKWLVIFPRHFAFPQKFANLMQLEDNKAHSVIISIFVTQIFQPVLVMTSKKQTNQGQSVAPLIKHCHLSTANPAETHTEGHTTRTHKQTPKNIYTLICACMCAHAWVHQKACISAHATQTDTCGQRNKK